MAVPANGSLPAPASCVSVAEPYAPVVPYAKRRPVARPLAVTVPASVDAARRDAARGAGRRRRDLQARAGELRLRTGGAPLVEDAVVVRLRVGDPQRPASPRPAGRRTCSRPGRLLRAHGARSPDRAGRSVTAVAESESKTASTMSRPDPVDGGRTASRSGRRGETSILRSPRYVWRRSSMRTSTSVTLPPAGTTNVASVTASSAALGASAIATGRTRPWPHPHGARVVGHGPVGRGHVDRQRDVRGAARRAAARSAGSRWAPCARCPAAATSRTRRRSSRPGRSRSASRSRPADPRSPAERNGAETLTSSPGLELAVVVAAGVGVGDRHRLGRRARCGAPRSSRSASSSPRSPCWRRSPCRAPGRRSRPSPK